MRLAKVSDQTTRFAAINPPSLARKLGLFHPAPDLLLIEAGEIVPRVILAHLEANLNDFLHLARKVVRFVKVHREVSRIYTLESIFYQVMVL